MYFSLCTSFVSILIFGCGCNELIKALPWRKMEFWWSLVHIFLMITASVVSFIALDKLSQTVTVNGQELKVSVLETEVIVIGVFCLLGECSKFYHKSRGPLVYLRDLLVYPSL